MAVFGTLPAVRAQLAAGPALQTALDHAEACLERGTPEHAALMALPQSASGKTHLANGVVALSSHCLTRRSSEGNWESHVENIDIHVLVVGVEWMDLADVSSLAFKEHQAEKDAIKYHPFAGGSLLVTPAGTIAVFFPQDGHRASRAVDDTPGFVRKVVLKVPFA